MSVRVFGIRHHGPGSARSLDAALGELRPDAILIEGPPDANDILALAAHESMRPPVALLVYVPAEPQRSVFYPLAEFSPEWIALRRGLQAGVPVRLIDLPQAHRLAQAAGEEAAAPPPDGSGPAALADDPLTELARAAGFDDGERWWERVVEERGGGAAVFDAVAGALRALRAGLRRDESRTDLQREAHMRQQIRAALAEGFERIAVVCGAWHVPALEDVGPAQADRDLLRGLPEVKVSAAWIPWTSARLALSSGYGAGVVAPGWYRHLWRRSGDAASTWMVHAARLLREQDLDASSAEAIDAVRLAECLAALRERPLVGLTELCDAAEAVLAHGSPVPMRLIGDRLLVGDEIGAVPAGAPRVPLLRDLEGEQRRLRLPSRAEEKTHDLDLRSQTDRERSRLLHRLLLLGIDWGAEVEVGRKRGTFHEVWRLLWRPELTVAAIEAGVWGGTVEDAALARVLDQARRATDLAALGELLDRVVLAELPAAAGAILGRIDAVAAVTADIGQLLDALPPLARTLRYGDVRRTSAAVLAPVVKGLAARAGIGLAPACACLDDEAAAHMAARIDAADQAMQALDLQSDLTAWRQALARVLEQPSIHGRVGGRVLRRLLDAREVATGTAATRFALAVSGAAPATQAAAWIEGFLAESGAILLHHPALWEIVDSWVQSLSPDRFVEALPLLRRTFSTFPAPERRKLGARARRDAGGAAGAASDATADVDPDRAAAPLPLLAKLLGLNLDQGGGAHD